MSAAAWFEGRPSSRVRGWRRVDKSLATRSADNHRHIEFSFAPRGVRVVALSSPPCNTARGVLPPLSHPDWPVKMGAWSPQTLRVARPSAERLSEVGTAPVHTPVLSDGTERFPRAVLGLICHEWGPGRPCVTRSLARSHGALIIGVDCHN